MPAANWVTVSIVLQPDTTTAAVARNTAPAVEPRVSMASPNVTSRLHRELFRQHRAPGPARELRGGAQRIFRSLVAPHGTARAGGHHLFEVAITLDEQATEPAAAAEAADAP